ncbi:MAG: threonine synthase [Actinomycetota bacterium]|jgi:threonine synthase
MRYVSTRGAAPELGFCDVLLAGLANDGGLYMPAEWPSLPDLTHVTSYAEAAAAVMAPFVAGEIDADVFARLCSDAYATFRHDAVVPLVQIGANEWLLEQFHGPTLAFKDVALQLVGRLFDYVLAQRGQRVTIVGATSGDTGSAAIDGVKNCSNVDIVILYPHGRTSDVQRKQMTTVDSPNVHTVAVEGTFDDCQDLVKAMFNDTAFRDRMNLSAVNSINWARVMAQIVYYVTATRSLGATATNQTTFSVPTGNFGNVLSGWISRTMGAPIANFIVASNSNDILTRFINDNDMTARDVVPTLSPSMDIQVSSNFERLLFEMNGRDGGMTAEQLQRFRHSGSLTVEPDQMATWISPAFRAAKVDDAGIVDEIRRVYESSGQFIDPHTATGTAAVRSLGAHLDGHAVVTLATAHPAKFPDAVYAATGVRPSLPPHLADLLDRPERTNLVANDLAAVQTFVERAVAR